MKMSNTNKSLCCWVVWVEDVEKMVLSELSCWTWMVGGFFLVCFYYCCYWGVLMSLKMLM